MRPHDRDFGSISKVWINHEKKNILSASADGTMFSYKIDLNWISKVTRGDVVTPETIQFEEFVGSIA